MGTPEFDHKAFADAIKSRLKYGDTLRGISSEMGVSLATLSRVMNGKEAKIQSLILIARWMGKGLDEFIHENPFY